MYICSNKKCRKRITKLDTKFTRCPSCGCRILYKERQPIAKEVATN